MATASRDILPFSAPRRPKRPDYSREVFLPTPAEIQQQCSLYQMQWSAEERKLRQTASLHSPTHPTEQVVAEAYAALAAKLQETRDRRYGFAG